MLTRSSLERDQLYTYTADGERLLVYDLAAGDERWTIRDLSGKVLTEYRAVDGAWTLERDTLYRDGNLLAAATPGQPLTHYHLDHLGTPRLLTGPPNPAAPVGPDPAGPVAEATYLVGRHNYLPFGEEATPPAQHTLRHRFTGHERDRVDTAATADDLDYMHARYYNPMLGRFLSFDPIGGNPHLPQSWNRYAYVLGNPVNYTDPRGLAPVPFFSPQLEYLIWAYATSDKITVTATPLTLDYLLHGAAMFGGYGHYLQAGFRDAGNRIAEGASNLLRDLDRALYGPAGEVSCFHLSNGDVICAEWKIGMMPFGPGGGAKLGPKVTKQMGARGWTRETIEEAIQSGDQIKAINKATGNPATRYVHPKTGQSVVVDNVTGEVIHIGGPGFKYGPGSGDLP